MTATATYRAMQVTTPGVLEPVDERNVLQVGNAAGKAAASAMAKHLPGAQVSIAAAKAEGRDGPLGSTGGAAKVGPVGADAPLVAGLPPQQ